MKKKPRLLSDTPITTTDEIQAAIKKATDAEKATGNISLVLTRAELFDLFDMLFALQKTDKGLVPVPREFQFQGRAQDVAASAAARTAIQGKVFELFRKLQDGVAKS